jgi:cytoskeletal protein CcmA (bactofilin family)
MFRKNRQTHKGVETLVGPETKISGDVFFRGHCHVDGIVKGSVSADPDTSSILSIADTGTVDGGVTVPFVVLNGIVKGDVFANQRVELGSTARVVGNVYYNLIQMAEGAEINGKLVHQPEGQVPLLEQTTRIDEKVAASVE